MKKGLTSVEEIAIYSGRLRIIVSNSKSFIEHYVSGWDKNGQEIYAHTWLTEEGGHEHYAIILNIHDKLPPTYGAVCHECVHVANMVMDRRGVVSDWVNDEPMAYLTQWVTDRVFSFLAKHKLLERLALEK